MTRPDSEERIAFDSQAHVFEDRAGLDEPAARRVAEAVLDMAGGTTGDLLVEIGAGTGQIGRWLAAGPLRYLGLDNSAGMLERFRPRLPADDRARLLEADADARWPAEDASVRAVFGSRVFHLLDAAHVASEFARIARPDRAVLLSGRIDRDPEAPRERIRRRMREVLEQHGLQPRAVQRRRRALADALHAHGAVAMETREAARWPVRGSAADALKGWRSKESLGGINPPPDIRARVLDELEAWARAEYGNPETTITTDECYRIEGFVLSAT